MPRSLRWLFLTVDLSFIAYWIATAARAIPSSWAFKDYGHPILSAWNWSFLPLDLLVSASGLASVSLARRGDERWRSLALVSLSLTSASGLQAISFWAARCDLDIGWWIPNLFLLLYPFLYLPRLLASLTSPGCTTRASYK
jgi:hypothetical protein